MSPQRSRSTRVSPWRSSTKTPSVRPPARTRRSSSDGQSTCLVNRGSPVRIRSPASSIPPVFPASTGDSGPARASAVSARKCPFPTVSEARAGLVRVWPGPPFVPSGHAIRALGSARFRTRAGLAPTPRRTRTRRGVGTIGTTARIPAAYAGSSRGSAWARLGARLPSEAPARGRTGALGVERVQVVGYRGE